MDDTTSQFDQSLKGSGSMIRRRIVSLLATRPCSISWIDSIDDRSQTPCFRTGATNATERRRGKAETVKVRDDASVTVERLGGRGTVDYRVSRRLAQESGGRISGCNLARTLDTSAMRNTTRILDRRYFNRRSTRFQVSSIDPAFSWQMLMMN